MGITTDFVARELDVCKMLAAYIYLFFYFLLILLVHKKFQRQKPCTSSLRT